MLGVEEQMLKQNKVFESHCFEGQQPPEAKRFRGTVREILRLFF